MLASKLIELKAKYNIIRDEIDTIKAGGDLGNLINLRQTFDETFDLFFDRKELRIKYNNWDIENDCLPYDIKSNSELEEILDDADLQDFVNFYENYIGELEDHLNELKSK